ncbi:MAG TPA: asparagine synthase (glutamine-hydrolyzing) [Vicinamibacterales bacterium]|nr:asparagine synthase (glutamine-hydrolyzing) [Vicinamibacterales bacterium]
MCGIAGLVEAGTADAAARARQVTRMREALAHRGPDGWGLAELHGTQVARHSGPGTASAAREGGAAPLSAWLGHQRLAIIDLTDAAAQPMRSRDGSGWLAFNGEIYNFREVQARFAAAPESNSDSAVLLEMIVAQGMQVLPSLRGMFAFAYWSEREQALYLARDRFGIKPLYWCRPSPGLLAFASEPRSLIAAGFGSGLRPGMQAVFLRRGHVPGDASAHAGLEVLPPGSWLRYDGRGVEITRWFDPQSVLGAAGTQPVERAAAAFQSALDDSIRAHLVSDVPVGVFLSGGLDSAAIVAAAARAGSAALRTFTVVVPGSAIDESAPAARIARQFGTVHTEVPVMREEIARWIEEGLDAMGEPTSDGLNTFMVSRAVARAGLKVVLSGLGGDELLGGYRSFNDVPRLWRATAPFRAGLPGRSVAAALAWLMPVAAPGKLAEIMREPARTRAGLWRQYRSLFERAAIRRLTGVEPPPDDQGPDVPGRSMLDVVMLCEIREYMASQLLRDSDAFSMCDSLELRVPFVDHQLMARVHEGGWWSRGRHATYKAALFAAMPDPLPADHLARRKTGFIIPMGDWLRAALAGDRALTVLHEPLRSPALRPYVDAFVRGRLDPNRLWALVVHEHFAGKYAHP